MHEIQVTIKTLNSNLLFILIILINGTLKRRSKKTKKQRKASLTFRTMADKEAREERSDRGGVKSVKPGRRKKKLAGLGKKSPSDLRGV